MIKQQAPYTKRSPEIPKQDDRATNLLKFERSLTNEERRFLLRGVAVSMQQILIHLAKKNMELLKEIGEDDVCKVGMVIIQCFADNDYKKFKDFEKIMDKEFDRVVFGEKT